MLDGQGEKGANEWATQQCQGLASDSCIQTLNLAYLVFLAPHCFHLYYFKDLWQGQRKEHELLMLKCNFLELCYKSQTGANDILLIAREAN